MTVQELIEELEDMPAEAQVLMFYDSAPRDDVNTVEVQWDLEGGAQVWLRE